MTRKCGSTKTLSGVPCDNDVADHEDHCRAGHFCPPKVAMVGVEDFAPLPPVVFDFESIAAPAPKSEEVLQEEQRIKDTSRGLGIAETFGKILGANVQYLDTARGMRKRLSNGEEVPFQLDRFLVGPYVFAYGDYGHQTFYLERACNWPDCETPAYVRLKFEHGDPKQLFSHEEWERRAAFKQAADEAGKTPAQCQNHRLPPVSWTEAQMHDEGSAA